MDDTDVYIYVLPVFTLAIILTAKSVNLSSFIKIFLSSAILSFLLKRFVEMKNAIVG